MNIPEKISLFSQSLFALNLDDAIKTTAQIGCPAIELACASPHFDITTARRKPERVADLIRHEGLAVSALSLFNNFTDPQCFEEQVQSAATYIKLAPLFGTKLVKMTPGPPASAEASNQHWNNLEKAMERLIPLAGEIGVRLAFETHMRQLTDTLGSSQKFLQIFSADCVGLTIDFSNLSFAGEKADRVVFSLGRRIYHTHLKNGLVDSQGGWHFNALDEGLTDYLKVLHGLRDIGYEGYLSIECLGEDARKEPGKTAQRDLKILSRLLSQVHSDK